MSWVLGMLAAFACFSAIPMPSLEWDGRTTRYLLAALPLVGVVIAASAWAVHVACAWLSAGPLLTGTCLALVGVAVTGGIHLDGFADVCDALASHSEPAQRRKILKDPHVGAFAVIGVVAYLLLAVALASELSAELVPLWCATYVVSRILCAAAALMWRPRPESGMLSALRDDASVGGCRLALALELAAVVAAAAIVCGMGSVVVFGCGLVCYGVVWRMSERSFDGLSGDIAGYLLAVSELVMQAAVICVGRVW